MKRTTKYVGLDVHQWATVASVRQENGRVIARSIVPTEEHALLEFVRGMRGSIQLTFEEGTEAQWLHDLLLPRVDHLVVGTHSSSDYSIVDGRPVRRRRGPMTRGLNRHHNRVLKNVFKGTASAAAGHPGALQDFYLALIERGVRPELARVTLARKLAALTLRIWKTGEPYDPSKLTLQAR